MKKIFSVIVSLFVSVTSLNGFIHAQTLSTRHSGKALQIGGRTPESRSLVLSNRHSGEALRIGGRTPESRSWTLLSSRATAGQASQDDNYSKSSRQYIPVSSNITLVSSHDTSDKAQESMLLKDYLSSTRAIINDRGETEQTLAYYPYGATHETWIMNHGSSTTQNSNNPKTAIQTQSGSAISGADLTTDKLFTSHRKLDNLTVYHAGARFYNPTLGLFIQPDKVEGINRYVYVANNPISYNDPDGRQLKHATASRFLRGFMDVVGRLGRSLPDKLRGTGEKDIAIPGRQSSNQTANLLVSTGLREDLNMDLLLSYCTEETITNGRRYYEEVDVRGEQFAGHILETINRSPDVIPIIFVGTAHVPAIAKATSDQGFRPYITSFISDEFFRDFGEKGWGDFNEPGFQGAFAHVIATDQYYRYTPIDLPDGRPIILIGDFHGADYGIPLPEVRKLFDSGFRGAQVYIEGRPIGRVEIGKQVNEILGNQRLSEHLRRYKGGGIDLDIRGLESDAGDYIW